MLNLGQTIGWQSRRNSREAAASSSLAERLDRYVASVAQPGRVLTPGGRLDYRTRFETVISRS